MPEVKIIFNQEIYFRGEFRQLIKNIDNSTTEITQDIGWDNILWGTEKSYKGKYVIYSSIVIKEGVGLKQSEDITLTKQSEEITWTKQSDFPNFVGTYKNNRYNIMGAWISGNIEFHCNDNTDVYTVDIFNHMDKSTQIFNFSDLFNINNNFNWKKIKTKPISTISTISTIYGYLVYENENIVFIGDTGFQFLKTRLGVQRTIADATVEDSDSDSDSD